MSSLCNYSDAYILVSGTVTITGESDDDVAKRLDEGNKWVIFKNCAPLTDCTSKINNTQKDNTKYIDITIIIRKHQELCGNITEMINLNHSNTKLK